jgi:pimeloyl-ACP methyl ester carboxylesterase
MDGVVFLHGLGLHGLAFAPMAWRIRKHGYRTLALTYPSLVQDIGGCAEYLHPAISQFASRIDGRLHFVTHSMGGLVVRAYLRRHRPGNLGRVVMLAPPNHGSEIADLLRNNPLYRGVFGPAGQQLTTQAALEPLLGTVDYPLGVIAGNKSLFPLSVIRGAHDGKVSVASTRIDGMADHIVLPVAHALMVLDARVAEQTMCFLKEGRFGR